MLPQSPTSTVCNEVIFGSQLVQANSRTPYSDATQVSKAVAKVCYISVLQFKLLIVIFSDALKTYLSNRYSVWLII